MLMSWRYFRRLFFTALFFITFVALTVFTLRVLSRTETTSPMKVKSDLAKENYRQYSRYWNIYNTSIVEQKPSVENGQELRVTAQSSTIPSIGNGISTDPKQQISTQRRGSVELKYDEEEEAISCSSRIHVFYYPWYGTPGFDGKYIHWNHEYLPHWDPNIAKRYRRGRHVPPKDIGSNYYPKLGCYSSRDPEVIDTHMIQMKEAGIGVVVVSWYPPRSNDGQGIPVDNIVPQILNVADNHGLKVTLHVEPYEGRSARTVQRDVKYIMDRYFNHPAFYKYKKGEQKLPFLYIYDSYHTKPQEWAQVLSPTGSHSMRNTKYDAVMIGLLVEHKHKAELRSGGFDGFYTYFASHGFTYGSELENWEHLRSFSEESNMLFIPSVGPGYIDTRVRPWNSQNTKDREKGKYYEKSLHYALENNPDIISITSFNEWHEGTQIEPAVPKRVPGFIYSDYSTEGGSDHYLKLTKQYVEKFKCSEQNQ